MRQMRIGLIGCGTIAPYWIKAAEILSVEIAAVCDRDPEALSRLSGCRKISEQQGVPENQREKPQHLHSEEASRQTDCQFFLDAERMLSAGIPMDAVVVATPPSTHAALARRVMEAGYPVIIEKPMAVDMKSCEELSEFAKRQHCFLGLAFHAASTPEIRWFRRHKCELEEELSALRSFTCTFSDPNVGEHGILERARGLHGSYLDSGVNALSTLQTVIGIHDFRCLNFETSLLRETTLASNTVYTDGNIYGNIITDWTRGQNFKCTRLYYDKGSVILNHSAREVTVISAKGSRTVCLANPDLARMEEQYVLLLTDLMERLKTGLDNREEAMEIHRLLFGNHS